MTTLPLQGVKLQKKQKTKKKSIKEIWFQKDQKGKMLIDLRIVVGKHFADKEFQSLETFDINMLLASGNGDRKMMLITINSMPSTIVKERDHFCQFRWRSSLVIPIIRLRLEYILMISHISGEAASVGLNCQMYLFLLLIEHIKVAVRSINSGMATVLIKINKPLIWIHSIQNNLEYLILNMIHQVTQILHSMLELIFYI